MEHTASGVIMEKVDTKRVYLNGIEPLKFIFTQNKDDFIVQEIPLKDFSNKGNFFIMKIKKTDLSTWQLIEHISRVLEIDQNKIGYAGLKDKNATTTQYISIPMNKSRDFKLIQNRNIKILETFQSDRKIKIGDLKGNRFKIVLKNILSEELPVFYQALATIQKHGIPNYFGYQRFGIENDFQKAKGVAYGEIKMENKKIQKFLTTAYQSYLFNAWLIKRVQISKEKNSKKLISLKGDVYSLEDKSIVTGLMCGRNIIRAKDEAGVIEEQYDDLFLQEKGSRRDAWIKPLDIKNRLLKNKNEMVLEFTLPKSSYATVFIEALGNKNLTY
jgi:tRNA pseudouridine13 synthase